MRQAASVGGESETFGAVGAGSLARLAVDGESLFATNATSIVRFPKAGGLPRAPIPVRNDALEAGSIAIDGDVVLWCETLLGVVARRHVGPLAASAPER